MIEEEKTAYDFVVEEFKKELKRDIYGDKEMIENKNKPIQRKHKKADNYLNRQLEMFEEQKLTKEQHYQQTLEKMLGRQKENEE
jgi:hypothetical protein